MLFFTSLVALDWILASKWVLQSVCICLYFICLVLDSFLQYCWTLPLFSFGFLELWSLAKLPASLVPISESLTDDFACLPPSRSVGARPVSKCFLQQSHCPNVRHGRTVNGWLHAFGCSSCLLFKYSTMTWVNLGLLETLGSFSLLSAGNPALTHTICFFFVVQILL